MVPRTQTVETATLAEPVGVSRSEPESPPPIPPGRENTAPSGDPAIGGRRGWLSLAHGAMLLLALTFFRIEKAVYLKLDLGFVGWMVMLLPEMGFAVGITTVGALLARSRHRAAATAWWILFPTLVLANYALALADHLFFLHTGTRLHLELLSYAAGNLRMLSDILGTGVSAVLWWRTALILLCLALATLWGWRRRRSFPVHGAAPVAVAGAIGLLLGWGALPFPDRGGALERSALPEFFSHLLRGSDFSAESLPVIAPDDLYRPPEVTAVGERRPNVVLVILESTRTDVVPPYAPRERWADAPALAELAGRAVVFDTVYASVTHTSKALIGLLCGMYPRLEMPIVESLAGNLPFTCLPELLQDLGYRTAFLQTASGRFENRPGLVRNLGFEQAAFLETLDRGDRFAHTGYFGLDEFAMLGPAVGWAAEGGAEPYLLTVLTVTPHHPYEVPEQRDAWRGESIEQYRAAIRHQDRFVGELVTQLEAAGALDDTVTLLIGDHGEAFGEHARLQHDAVPYEEVVRVPLLVLGPKERVGPPRRVGGLRHHLDLLPSVLGLTSAEWHGRLPGEDLFASSGHARVVTSCWYTDYCLAMREGERKVIFHFWRRPTEIFDLSRDPGERHNLASELPVHELREAEGQLLALKQSVDDFHAGHPVQEGSALWWNRPAEQTSR